MDDRIILDEKSFKALSADSRVNILKNLSDRRRTLTELSQKLSLGNSTIKEHCDILVGAELIKQVDEGRKWKYYELTKKGKQIIQPSLMDEVKVLIMLCIGVFLVGGTTFILLQSVSQTGTTNYIQATDLGAQTLKTTAIGIRETNTTITPLQPIVQGISFEAFTISTLVALIIGIIIGWLFTRKIR